MDIGERIKQRRIELGLTQEELAKKLGYTSKTTIAKIESNANQLRQSKIKAIADALETTPAYIMGWNEEEQKSINDEYGYYLMGQAYDADISIEALKLAQGFDKLDEEGKRQLIMMLAFLKDQNGKK